MKVKDYFCPTPFRHFGEARPNSSLRKQPRHIGRLSNPVRRLFSQATGTPSDGKRHVKECMRHFNANIIYANIISLTKQMSPLWEGSCMSKLVVQPS